MYHIDFSPFQKVDALAEPVFPGIDDTLDAGLYYQFGAFYAWSVGDVERRSVAVVGASGEFRYGVCLGMEHVGVSHVVLVLTHVLESAWRAVVAVADYHFVFHDKASHLSSLAVAVLRPDTCHAQVFEVKPELFLFVVHDC